MKGRFGAVLGVVLVLGVAGCGGSGSDDVTAVTAGASGVITAPADGDLGAKADAVCRQIFDRAVEAQRRVRSQHDDPIARAISLEKAGLEVLDDIDSSGEGGEAFDQLKTALGGQLELIEQAHRALVERDTAAVKKLARRVVAQRREAQRVADELGARACTRLL